MRWRIPVVPVLPLLAFVLWSCDQEPNVYEPEASFDVTPAEASSFTGLAESGAELPAPADPAVTSTASTTNANGLVFFTDRAAFDARCPTLPLETFENVNQGGICSGGSSLNSATDDACYSPGAVLAGFTLTPSANNYVAISPPDFGLSSVVVGPNFFADDTEIAFSPGATGAGFDLIDVFGGSSWNIEVFSASGSEGSTTSGAGFVGVFSPIPLTRIEVTPLGGVAGELFDDLAFGPCIIFVDLDIKPGSYPNSINPKSNGVVPVAILGSDVFDVTDVDVTTLAFGPDGANPAHDLTNPATYWDHIEDVNFDGYDDLVSHYRQKQTGLAPGDTEACISGATLGGTPIEGCDSVRILGD